MSKAIRKLAILIILLSMVIPFSAFADDNSTSAVVNITLLHTNDFHGNLELSGSNPGISRVAAVIKGVQASVGAENTLLLDAGDIMQGSLLSNLKKGEPTIDLYNYLGYGAATFGNHEYDWGQDVLQQRVDQADFPFIAANLVKNDTGNCSTAGWTPPAYAQPYILKTVGAAGNQAQLGIIGVTSVETPYITIASATEGLCFKDPATSIIHYYDQVKAEGADAIVVLSHNGYTDGGYGYGFPVYGDQTLAKKLIEAGKQVPLIIGGHSHTDLASATDVSGTTVVQAHYAGRKVGRADLSINTDTGEVTVAWQRLTVSPTGPEDPDTAARVATWTSDPAYQAQINEVIGYTNVPLTRNYNGDSMMGAFIQDAVYGDLNSDSDPSNDVDMVFNNPGGIRADIVGTSYPYTLTYGSLFSVLPFGNATAVGSMTGGQIAELLNQSATLFKGALQVSGIQYNFYVYTDTLPGPQPYAWGAFDIDVKNRTTGAWEDLDLKKTYRVATNEFLAPAGQDGFTPFKYMTNISYWGDMLNGVNRYVSSHYTLSNPYNGPNGDGLLDARIEQVGTVAGGPVIPLTILHHNDSHGRLAPTTSGTTTYAGYTQLASLIKQERAHNPDRNILLQGGDQIQGDSMMYYFKSAPSGFAADGTPLPADLQTHPMMAVMNSLGYDAMALGNHEFNFGGETFTGIFKQAQFPLLGANVVDAGQYGLAQVGPGGQGVKPSVTLDKDGIKVAVLGITNHRVPNYELPSNIVGLTFSNPIDKAKELTPDLAANNDVVIALTHIGFTTNPKSVEVDDNVDTNLAGAVTGIDAIIGAHSHTDPTKPEAPYKYLPTIVSDPDGNPVIINQAYRYNTYLGQVVLGLLPKAGGGYEVISRAGRAISVVASGSSATPEDAATKAIVDPYVTALNAYNNQVVGQTTAPIDTMAAFTQETNGANLQADASVWALKQKGIEVDFHLSGAMTNKLVAEKATPESPVTLTISDMFNAMPYENSLVVMRMNGPQLKKVLERAYRNYYYYKYVPGYGGYSYYTTCMIDINSDGAIRYNDANPFLPNGDNVKSLVVNGKAVDFKDADTYYKVSTVNYLAAGSCNFNDSGVSLWPLDQIVNDTQYYVRDVVIDYTKDQGVISPAIEGRLVFGRNLIFPLIFKR